ncbi:MAG: hypothetical protein GYB58_18350 [Gammaproteobacteria bacterium]|nr:hypothetical protein [Gammaproteobacteria bacterium]
MHPLGQTLIATSGVCWTWCEGGKKNEMRAGDIIWCNCAVYRRGPDGHRAC